MDGLQGGWGLRSYGLLYSLVTEEKEIDKRFEIKDDSWDLLLNGNSVSG